MDTREWYVVSDLHLNGEAGPRDVDAALPGFLDTVVRASTSVRRDVVLLGDTFDLQGPAPESGASVAKRLGGLADAHAGILDALAGCVRSGIGLHLVGGNHDMELTRPGAAALFTTLLGLEVGHPGVRFSPWVVHEPGVFYAEHGNQHHELNRMPTVLSVRERGGRREELPVTPLGAAGRGHPSSTGQGAAAVRVARALRATGRHERMARTAWYRRLLDREAAGLGLSGRALAEVATLSGFGARGLTATARRTVERRVGVQRPGTYLAPRAAAIHRILTRHGMPAAAYVFGHNHRAERLDLPDPPAAVYLNAGTWCTEVRGPGPDRSDHRLFPFVRIAATPGGVEADLRFWRHSP
jgi:UDP-2,3-diacylglucosamine pyrophosphatase LpxH